MNTIKQACLCAVLSALPAVVSAADLKVTTIAWRDLNCAFQPACAAIDPQIFQDVIALPAISGTAQLQTKTFLGASGTPADGKTVYLYQLDLSKAAALNDVACVTDLHVNFGAVSDLRYSGGSPSAVFVVDKSGSGGGEVSATQTGEVITFTFEQPVCTSDTSGDGKASSVFGLTSQYAPKAITVKVGTPGVDHVDVKALVPMR